MRTILVVTVIVVILISNTPLIEGKAFSNIPSNHWIYDALMDVAEADLISYPVDVGRKVTMSRLEVAMLVAAVLETDLLNYEPRDEKQQELVIGVIESFAKRAETGSSVISWYKQNVTKDVEISEAEYEKLFTIVPAAMMNEIKEEITLQFNYSPLLTLIIELESELNALGIHLTEVEKAFTNYVRPTKPQHKLTLNNHFKQTINMFALKNIVYQMNQTLQSEHETDVLANLQSITEFKDSLTGRESNTIGGRQQLGITGKESGLFSNYHFIDFGSAVQPSMEGRPRATD